MVQETFFLMGLRPCFPSQRPLAYRQQQGPTTTNNLDGKFLCPYMDVSLFLIHTVETRWLALRKFSSPPQAVPAESGWSPSGSMSARHQNATVQSLLMKLSLELEPTKAVQGLCAKTRQGDLPSKRKHFSKTLHLPT